MTTKGKRRNREHARAQAQRYRAENPERYYTYHREWVKRNPERRKRMNRAHYHVHQAIKRGELVRGTSCEVCNKAGFCQASHTDYSRPLDVQWLCRSCHRIEDMQRPKTVEVEE